jgi:flagellar biosynthesis/type III secretory pathway protein FliH
MAGLCPVQQSLESRSDCCLRKKSLNHEPSFYQRVFREGWEAEWKKGFAEGWNRGFAKGLMKGQRKEDRKRLVRLGRRRFGRLDKPTRTAIESIDDLKRLERLLERVHAASSWADVLAESK